MNFNDLLKDKGIDPAHVLVLRHRPREPELRKVLPWLAVEKPHIFNAYQQTQGKKLEKVMIGLKNAGYVASFIGNEPGKALFVGLFSIGESRPLTRDEYFQVPAHIEFKVLGATCEPHDPIMWFDLSLVDIYADWKGKLIIKWPPPELSWWRWANRNEIPIHAILEVSALDTRMPEWNEIVFTWEELRVLPLSWKNKLKEWRGIYYIFETSSNKGYVGSAYGEDNLLGRWKNYAAHGDGGNRLLKRHDPHNFRFSILQRLSPDIEPSDIIRLESFWKERLHTRDPYGLNDN